MRKLASIQRIKKLQAIPKADRIEVALFEDIGWQCVVKKGEFKPGDFCIYFEIDSLLPDVPQFEFLRQSSWKENLKAYRLRTVKLKGELSQGLALPLSSFPDINFSVMNEGDDVTELLNVKKYVPEVPVHLMGDVNAFDWPIAKTDEERIQANPKILYVFKGKPYYSTIKLDGTSGSFILKHNRDTGELDFHVCSRNHSIRRPEQGVNTYWEIADVYGIQDKLESYYEKTGKFISIQGEICGPGIQKNPLGLESRELFIFNVVHTDTNERMSYHDMIEAIVLMNKLTMSDMGRRLLKMVPVVEVDDFLFESVDEMLKYVNKDYEIFGFLNSKKPIEGMVFRTIDGLNSFKVINNTYLLQEE